MYKEKKISLVIPAHNEEALIIPTLKGVPALIDKVFVVDDGSTDKTVDLVSEYVKKDRRVTLIQHEKNSGVGSALITGYKKSAEDGFDICVVVGGDNQMPLDTVSDFLEPLIAGEADYTKGNRFLVEENVFEDMPAIRLIGNSIISLITKIASGYYKIFDFVDGYTAITKKAIETINWDKAWKGYGYPMDFLIRLNAYGFKVKDIPRKAIYLPGQRQSQIKGLSYAVRVTPMLVRDFLWRITKRYAIRDFHPLVLFYFGGIVMLPVGVLFGLYLLYRQTTGFGVSGPRAILCALLIMAGLQFLFFAMLFDMQQSE